MFRQLIQVREIPIAIRAQVGALRPMRAHMNRQIMRLAEGFRAMFAFVGTATSVQTPVFFKRTQVDESFMTYIALVFFIFIICGVFAGIYVGEIVAIV